MLPDELDRVIPGYKTYSSEHSSLYASQRIGEQLYRKYTQKHLQVANYLSILRTSGINAIPRIIVS
jgi:hypothetical protein